MVSRSSGRTQKSWAAPPVASYPHGSNARRGVAPLYCSYHTRCQYGNYGRMQRRRPRIRRPTTSLLYQWSTFWVEGAIPTDLETPLCNINHIKEVTALLWRVQDLNRHRLPAGWYLTQSGCDWSHLKMGSRTRSTRAEIHAKNNNQVSSPCRFPG